MGFNTTHGAYGLTKTIPSSNDFSPGVICTVPGILFSVLSMICDTSVLAMLVELCFMKIRIFLIPTVESRDRKLEKRPDE